MKSSGTGDTHVTARDCSQANTAIQVSERFIKQNASNQQRHDIYSILYIYIYI